MEGVPKPQARPRLGKYRFYNPRSKDKAAFKAKIKDRLPNIPAFGTGEPVVANIKLPSQWLCAIVAAISGVLTYSWPHQSGLLFSSIFAIAIGVSFEVYCSRTKKSALAACSEEA